MDRRGQALVFAGGGGNGAFEIGVWRALRETDIFDITAVSGSSVGALNAALFAGGNYDMATELWQGISNESIKVPFKSLNERLSDGDSRGGIWSPAGVESIIRAEGFISGIKNSKIPCAVCCTLAPENTAGRVKGIVTYRDEVRYFILNDEPEERIVRILLASTAILHGFPEQKIDGRFCRDGDNVGRGDCMPIQPLYNMGWRRFIVVHLDNYKKLRLTPEAEADNSVEYMHIYPPHELDNPLTILDFGHESVMERMEMGYKAATEILNKIKAQEI